MQITLNQDEIHIAVEQYVRGQINIADNQSVDIDFTAGRGANGLSATLDIRAAGSAPAPKPASQTVGKEEPKAEAPKPKPAPVKEQVKEEPAAEAEEPDVPEEAAPEAEEEKAPPAKPKGPSIFAKG